jgi:hypothetical protein
MASRRETTLWADWSKRQQDVVFHWPDAKADGRLLYAYLACERREFDGTWGPSLLKELEARGYDLTTLRFSIKKKVAK